MADRLKLPLGKDARRITPLEWLDLVILKAVEMKASDIHFDIKPKEFVTRFRIDGMLRTIDRRSTEHYDMIVSRLKVMSVLNTMDYRSPQEGHAMVQLPGAQPENSVDIRISVFPTIYGEAAALRILNRRDFLFDTFQEMGIANEDAERLEETIRRPYGMILVTGPTGSGKTAMLYTALNKIRSTEKNIITLEDPVEYELEDTRQSQINPNIDYTFAKGMRSILRQDPDIIMIGEIRDDETAEIAVRAALTGCLVFSTMHTNDSAGAVIRFLEFGIPRSFVAAAVTLVIAKRLIRKNCPNCLQSYVPSEKFLRETGWPPQDLSVIQWRRGAGCETCDQTGFCGRVGVHEFFYLDQEIRMAILDGISPAKLTQILYTKGMKTLRQDAIRLAQSGATPLEEALVNTV